MDSAGNLLFLAFRSSAQSKDPDLMAKVVVKAVMDKKPKIAYGCNHNLTNKLINCLPASVIDKLLYKPFA